MNKSAQSSQFNLFTVMIVGILFVLFSAGLIYVSGILNDVFHNVGVMNDKQPHENSTFPCLDDPTKTCGGNFYVNMTLASDQIWGQHYQSIQALRMVSIVYFLAMLIGVIIVGVLERKHPILFLAYLLFVILGVVFSPSLSNAYESLLNQGIFGGELSNFTASNFIILNLPVIVLVVGAISSIFLFINLVRGSPEGSNLQ